MSRRINTCLAATMLAIAFVVLQSDSAVAWVRENLRDLPGHSNLNLHVAGGRLTFEIERSGSSKIHDGSDLAAIRAAMRTLSSVDGASVTITDGGFCDIAGPIHSRDGLKQDGHNRIYFFHEHDSTFGALAYTGFFYNLSSGEIVEADTALNEADFTFSTRTPQNANEFLGSGTADLQEVVTHELMHALGFDHSAIAGRFDPATGREVAGYSSHDFSLQSTIYPITSQTIQGRKLSEDDIAGLRAVYGSGTATLSGRVVDGATGKGLKGVHVVAVRPDDVDVPVVGTISGTGDASGPGEFVLAGLSPGSYYLRIEPLGGGSNPFIGAYTNYSGFKTSFEPEFYSGDRESSRDTVVQMTDAAMISVSQSARVGSVVIVTNSTPPPMSVSSAVLRKDKLKVTGSSFPVGSTAFEINGVRFSSVKYPQSASSNGLASRLVSKDPQIGAMMGSGDAMLVVVDLATGERTAPMPIQR